MESIMREYEINAFLIGSESRALSLWERPVYQSKTLLACVLIKLAHLLCLYFPFTCSWIIGFWEKKIKLEASEYCEG